jgi:hypothetical protein
VYEEQVLSQKDRNVYERRTRVYKITTEQQILDAVRETRDMNRVPLFVRTPKNKFTFNDVKQRLAKAYNLGHSADGGLVQEINLRLAFTESFGNPIKKSEQRDKINLLVKRALLTN